MQKERLQERVIEEIHRLDYSGPQQNSAFIAGLESVKARGKECEGTEYVDG